MFYDYDLILQIFPIASRKNITVQYISYQLLHSPMSLKDCREINIIYGLDDVTT